ncbi:hypothetical protein JZ751_000124 [Albula glossodonta]|uniref:Uncharacterized protein n=1 Tax=Albula glossodonta TaxID=121402 RepID=A0A8T2PVN2_9TELE|nr:hypothetical protein JZ751_000124 [Albula glossodonta]
MSGVRRQARNLRDVREHANAEVHLLLPESLQWWGAMMVHDEPQPVRAPSPPASLRLAPVSDYNKPTSGLALPEPQPKPATSSPPLPPHSPLWMPLRSLSCWSGRWRILKERTAFSSASDMRAISRPCSFPFRTGNPDTTM